MSSPKLILGAACLVLFLCAFKAQAQNTDSATAGDSSQAAAPYPPLVSWGSNTGALDPKELTPDEHPLTGVQGLTLGQNSEAHSFLLPSINITTQLNSNPPGSGSPAVSSLSYLLGRVDMNRVSGRSEMLLDYAGGGTVVTGGMSSALGSNVNSVIQNLGFSDNFKWQRWSVLLGDQASYLSDSPFGFGGVGGLGNLGGVSQLGGGSLLGGGLPALNTALTPSQTIPTASAPRVSESAFAQVQYLLSPRSSWTASGSYGLLHFYGVGYFNSNSELFQTGYNYQVSAPTSIAFFYRLSSFQYPQQGQGISAQALQFSYARRVTGRLSFQIAAGPELQTFQAPLTASSTQVSWTLDSALNYQVGGTSLSVKYDHLLTAGSGVMAGAETDQVLGTVGRSLSQSWQGSVSFGYASNRGLAQTTPSTVSSDFNSWYGTLGVNHQLRPGMSLFFTYGARLEGANTEGCTANCGANYVTNSLSVGFNWGLRPVTLF